jgi:hypothetical protein
MGSLIATGLIGLIGYSLWYRAMFVIAVALALPLLVALAAIRASDFDLARSCGVSYPNAPILPATSWDSMSCGVREQYL